MTGTLRLRRGTTAQTAAFTGAQAEITMDTDKNTVVVHDGSTSGGFDLLRADMANMGSITANLVPDLDNALSLGTSTKKWKDAYFGTVSASAITGSLTGNASTATKLATPRTVALTGAVTGSASFDGSGDISISTTGGTVTNVAGTMMVMVDEQVITSPTSSVTFTGLDGDSDVEYEIHFSGVNGGTVGCFYLLRPNNDTSTTRYYQQTINSTGTTSSAGGSTVAGILLGYAEAGRYATSTANLRAKSGTVRLGNSLETQSATTSTAGIFVARSFEWIDTTTNITSLTIAATDTNGAPGSTTPVAVANGMGAGTRIALYARKKIGGSTSNVSATFRGALLKRSSAQSILNTTWTPVVWDAAQYDTDGFWSASNPTRLTIPAGVNKVRITSAVSLGGTGAMNTRISKNGTQVYPIPYAYNSNPAPMDLSSPAIPVQAGDYFTVDVHQASGATQALNNQDYCYFGLEIVDPVPVAISGFGNNTTTDYGYLTLTANQTTGLTVGNYIKFDKLTGSGITLDSATGKIRLKAGKTYALNASLFPTFSVSNGQFYVQWRNVTANTLLGNMGGSDNEQATYNQSAGSLCQAVITPMVDTDVALEITVSGGAATSILANLSSAMVTQIGGPANGLNYGPAGYAQMGLSTSPAITPSNGYTIPFDTFNGNLTQNGSGITLKAGRTYLLQGSVYATSSGGTYLNVQFNDGTNYLGTGGQATAVTNAGNVAPNPTAVAIYRPAVDTTVYLKVQGYASGFTYALTGGYGYMMAVELASTVDTYSTTETLTGKVWIDGKPIYRKVVSCGALPNATTKMVAHGITGLTRIIEYKGSAVNSSGGTMQLPYVGNSVATASITLYADFTNIIIVTYSDQSAFGSCYVTIEYTK